MKSGFFFCLVAALLPLNAQAENVYPKRKPGLWEIQITNQNGAAGPTVKQCIDEATDAKMQQPGGQMAKLCHKQEMVKQGQGYVSDSECNINGSKIASHGVFKGDFISGYSAEITATYEPPLMGLKESKSSITARYLGACEAGQMPGDTILPNGMKVNVNTPVSPETMKE